MNEIARLAFMLGRICATYSKDYLRSEAHRNETINFHLRELCPTPASLQILREVLKEEYGK